MAHQRVLDVALLRPGAEAEEVEAVGVLQRLDRERRARLGQVAIEVRRRAALPLVEAALELVQEDVARAAVGERLLRVVPSLGVVLRLREEHEVHAPAQSSNNLLDDLLVGPRLGERPHVHEVRAR